MTVKDKKLIEQAKRLQNVDWDIAFRMAEQAETPEAYDKLRDIGKILYREEEFYAGLL